MRVGPLAVKISQISALLLFCIVNVVARRLSRMFTKQTIRYAWALGNDFSKISSTHVLHSTYSSKQTLQNVCQADNAHGPAGQDFSKVSSKLFYMINVVAS